MTAPTKHATTADINAILAARKNAQIETADTHMLTTQQQANLGPVTDAQPSLPLTQPAALPTLVVAPTPSATDEQVSEFLNQYLPALIQAVHGVVTPPFNVNELFDLAAAISAAVAHGLPQLKGMEARALVVVLARYLWRNYATPALPAMVKPFASVLEGLLISGIEAAYQLAVKPQKAAQ